MPRKTARQRPGRQRRLRSASYDDFRRRCAFVGAIARQRAASQRHARTFARQRDCPLPVRRVFQHWAENAGYEVTARLRWGAPSSGGIRRRRGDYHTSRHDLPMTRRAGPWTKGVCFFGGGGEKKKKKPGAARGSSNNHPRHVARSPLKWLPRSDINGHWPDVYKRPSPIPARTHAPD